MDIFRLKSRIFFAVFFVCNITLFSVSYGDDDLGEEYGKQLIIEMQLLEKLESRFDILNESFRGGRFPAYKGPDGKTIIDEEGSIQVFADVQGLRIVRKLHKYGIYLFSVEADHVVMKDVLGQLALANSIDILFERVEPAFLQKRINVSLNNLPYQDIVEIITGMFGLEFVLNNEGNLKITLPSNLGIKDPGEYFRNKIIKTYRKVQIKYSDNEFIPESYFKLGEYFAYLGLNIIASQEFMVVTERYPKHELVKDSLVKLAKCYTDLGDLKKARDVYNNFINRFPNDESLINIYWDFTDTWYREKKYDIAISIYKKMIEMFSYSDMVGKIRLRMVSAYMESGQYSKAFNTLIALKKRERTVEWGIENDLMLGESLYHMGKYRDSFMVLAGISKNKELAVDDIRKVNYMIADNLFKTENYVESIDMFKKWILKYGDDAYAMLVLGRSLKKLNLYDTAIEILERANSRFSDTEYSAQIKYELGLTYYNNEKFEQAIKLFDEIALNEESDLFIDSKFYVAESLLKMKEYNDAVKQYENILVFYENRSLTSVDTERYKLIGKRIGTCYQSMGQYTKALDSY